MRRFALTLAALAVAAAPALAEDDSLSADEARAFFASLGERAEEAVADGDWQGIQDWMTRHVADEANIALTGTLVTTDGPVMTYDSAMRGRDLKRFSALSMATAGPMMAGGGALSGYAAHANVGAVRSLPGGTISLEVRFWEHGQLDLSAMAAARGAEAGGTAPPGGAPVTFESVSDCSFRVARRDGAITIQLAACETDTTM
jgi:hypothetical protein